MNKHRKIVLIISCIVLVLFICYEVANGGIQISGFSTITRNIKDGVIRNTTGDPDKAGKEPSEKQLAPYYRDTIEDALREGIVLNSSERRYMKDIDQVVKKIENDNYVLIYYISKEKQGRVAINMCKFKLKNENGKKMYAALFSEASTTRTVTGVGTTHKEIVENRLRGLSLMQDFSLDPSKKIMWDTSKSDKIYSLKIDGQAPDEIVPFEVAGNTWYLWYYLDLKTDNAPKDMVVEMDE